MARVGALRRALQTLASLDEARIATAVPEATVNLDRVQIHVRGAHAQYMDEPPLHAGLPVVIESIFEVALGHSAGACRGKALPTGHSGRVGVSIRIEPRGAGP